MDQLGGELFPIIRQEGGRTAPAGDPVGVESCPYVFRTGAGQDGYFRPLRAMVYHGLATRKVVTTVW